MQHFILQPQEDKDYVELMFWGDVHLGHPQCLWRKALSNLNYALAHRIFVVLMGDLIDAQGTDNDIIQMVKVLKPLAKEKLLIGLHSGNHETRITKKTKIDVSKKMAGLLDVPYFSDDCLSSLQVGRFYYNLYSIHGYNGLRFKSTRLKLAHDLICRTDVDIIAIGHIHSLGFDALQPCKIILTGSYLPRTVGRIIRAIFRPRAYPFPQIGSPILRLYATQKRLVSAK